MTSLRRNGWGLAKERHSDEQNVRVHAGVGVAPVRVRNVMILVAKVDAVVPGGEHLHARPELGGEIELSGVEHPTIKSEEASAARKKWLNSPMGKEINLRADWASTTAVGIYAAVSLWLAN